MTALTIQRLTDFKGNLIDSLVGYLKCDGDYLLPNQTDEYVAWLTGKNQYDGIDKVLEHFGFDAKNEIYDWAIGDGPENSYQFIEQYLGIEKAEEI